jgi:hypothetical protein
VSKRNRLLLPLGFLLTLLVGLALSCGDLVDERRFASSRTWE